MLAQGDRDARGPFPYTRQRAKGEGYRQWNVGWKKGACLPAVNVDSKVLMLWSLQLHPLPLSPAKLNTAQVCPVFSWWGFFFSFFLPLPTSWLTFTPPSDVT